MCFALVMQSIKNVSGSCEMATNRFGGWPEKEVYTAKVRSRLARCSREKIRQKKLLQLSWSTPNLHTLNEGLEVGTEEGRAYYRTQPAACRLLQVQNDPG
jgi:hypothetical protein